MSRKRQRERRADVQTSQAQGDQTIASIPESNASEESAGVAGGLLEGMITEGSRGRYRVETASGALWCTLRGRLRKELIYAESASARRSAQRVNVREGDPVAIGDRVWALPVGAGEGVIERVAPRTGAAMARQDPDKGRAKRPLTAVSGINQLVIVFAAREPAPHLRLADRFIALAEAQGAAVVLCVNKADQGIEPWLDRRLAVYAGLGYAAPRTSAATGAGIEALAGLLAGRVSAFAGPSGVGKTSLLNALEPGLALRVSAVSESTGKGRHTTTGARLIPLAGLGGGWIADTAGIRALALDPATLDNLPETFREFRPYLGACAFSDCRHLAEPGCAIHAAVRTGAIDAARYDSYHRIVLGAPASADLIPLAGMDGYEED
ncbi:MAG TPA: ribosome small subunit-dependent GTPase A [Ktedonobacterales bacterium]|nr:ribosome small subunit-dependent GTPase A [Ktedonobacterales bacterium]